MRTYKVTFFKKDMTEAGTWDISTEVQFELLRKIADRIIRERLIQAVRIFEDGTDLSEAVNELLPYILRHMSKV